MNVPDGWTPEMWRCYLSDPDGGLAPVRNQSEGDEDE